MPARPFDQGLYLHSKSGPLLSYSLTICVAGELGIVQTASEHHLPEEDRITHDILLIVADCVKCKGLQGCTSNLRITRRADSLLTGRVDDLSAYLTKRPDYGGYEGLAKRQQELIDQWFCPKPELEDQVSGSNHLPLRKTALLAGMYAANPGRCKTIDQPAELKPQ